MLTEGKSIGTLHLKLDLPLVAGVMAVRFDPMLPIPFALVQVASTSFLYAAPRPRNMVSSVPSRLGEHPGEATLLHGKAVKARSATSKIHTSGLWIDKLSNQELLSQEESRNATPTREPVGGGLDLPPIKLEITRYCIMMCHSWTKSESQNG